MHPFEYLEANSVSHAVELLSLSPDDTRIIAGGMDLLGEMKEGTAAPRRLVSLAGLPELSGITENNGDLSIGAMVTITELEHHPTVRSRYIALKEAAERLATPQIRNVGTLSGNLCQRPRCWYYRNLLTPCLKRGGDLCYALAGRSKDLCVTGGEGCYIVHPSDTAVPLAAFGASIEIAGPNGARTLPLGEFFAAPGDDMTRENVLGAGELVTHVTLPGPQPGSRSLFLKVQERVSGGFALASVAAVLTVEDGIVGRASVVLGGVAPVPRRAVQVEEYLEGRPISDVDPAHAGSLALPDATPLKDNRYKVFMARNLVKRAVGRLVGG